MTIHRPARFLKCISILLLVSELGLIANASEDIATARTPPETPPAMRAFPAQEIPEVDGAVLGDSAWEIAEPAKDFWQTAPDENQPSSQQTEVRMIYSASTLFIGVICYDTEPNNIIVADSRRDSPLTETDSFQIILDTFRDSQNGFVFGTNPAGIEYDGQVTREGQGTGSGMQRQTRGAGGGFNLNWDGSWVVRTQTGDFGWSAEFAIPFRTLRFGPEKVQTWGVNFQRNIRRRNEKAFWAPLSRQFNLYRVSLAGTVSDLVIERQHTLQISPYVLGEVRKQGGRDKTNWGGDVGVDAKYRVTPSLTLDGTYNTDFAQVEVDEFQVNLDRFNLFFPEKRPFFLENAGFFTVGSPGEVDIFFSRRIGIGPGGEMIPILAGGRLSGRVGDRTNLGLLNMQTQGQDGVAPSNNFTVMRMSQEFQNRTSLGGIFVNRQGTGEFAADEDYNRTYGFDGSWGIGEYTDVTGFVAKTSTPELHGEDHAFKFGARYDSAAWLFSANYTEVGENFNPEVGFLSREGFRKTDWMVMYRYRPDDFLGFLELRPHISQRAYWDFEGFQETGWTHIDNHWEWKSGAAVHTGVNLTKEGLLEEFEIAPGIFVPPGTYDHAEAQLVALSDQGAWISGRLESRFGGFFGGDRVNL
ncbi:MAG: carbohydrate binding family 9 domain-containing protein, partial [Acidobacteriota bacterium]